MHATLILTNGPVYTLSAAQPRASAVALAGNRILAVGDAAEVSAWRGPRTETIDLGSRPLLPAFADSHIHFGKLAQQRQQIDLSQTHSSSEAAALVAGRAATTPPGRWLRGAGWDRNSWADTALPTKELLDSAAPDHPVALASKDLHSLWVNTPALAAAGISSSSQDPPGGVIVRQEQGEPTGILLETATRLVSAVYARPSPEEYTASIREAFPLAWAEGITSIHEMGDSPDGRSFRAFQCLQSQDALGLRVLYYLPLENLDHAVALGLRSGLGDARLRVGGVKLFADGSLGSRTAWMLEPFADEPGNLGVAWMEPEELQLVVSRASQAGLAVAVHALGDRANREAIDAIAAGSSGMPAAAASQPALRQRIEHAQLLHPTDIGRLASLGMVASMQPSHCPADMEMADRHWGEPRCRGAYAWRSLLDAGTRLAFGSDGPVEPISVLAGIHSAVTRRRANGWPGPSGWHPEQRLSLAEAVHAYTLGAAYAAGEERWRGSISPGRLADLVVLSQDVFSIDPQEIRSTRVDLTIFDGQVVYAA